MKVKFQPQNLEVEIKPGQTIMTVAHENGVVINSACNGMPSCAECRIKVIDGEWNINPPSRKELSLIGTGYYIDQRRLSCQMLCFGDVTVDTSEQVARTGEGPVTKKFLTKVQKSSAQESFSLGGVLIEQDGQLLAEMKKDVPQNVMPAAQSASLTPKEKSSRPPSQDGNGGPRRSRGGRGRGRRGGKSGR